MSTYQPFVVLDVDGVCVDYFGRPMPGIVSFVAALRLLGYLVVLWSAGGKDYCAEVADDLGITVDGVFAKPDYPIQEAEAMKLFSVPPALQVDDDATERVGDWPFLHVTEAEEMAGYLLTRAGGSQDRREAQGLKKGAAALCSDHDEVRVDGTDWAFYDHQRHALSD